MVDHHAVSRRAAIFSAAGAMMQLTSTEGNAMQVSDNNLEQARVAAAAQNAFGLKMLGFEAEHRPGKNVFLSPVSVFLALAMTEGGSAGKTRAAMRHALSIPDSLPDEAFQAAASALSTELRTRSGGDLLIANALWADKGFPFAPAFVRKCRELYEADATTLDFALPDPAAEAVNAWVRQKTKEKIPSIVTPEQVRDTKAILTNAVYFQGKWRSPFSTKETETGVFRLTGGRRKDVPFMHQAHLRGAYRAGDGYEAAELVYQRPGFCMYVILPSEGTSPEKALGKVSVEKLIRDPSRAELEVKLPRFTLDFGASLKASLIRSGMGLAFQYPGAEFAPMGSPLFYIGEVLHKTRLEVDEEGTVAAAATAVMMMVGAGRPQVTERKVLVFDRPFGVLLCDTATGTVLFAGAIYEP